MNWYQLDQDKIMEAASNKWKDEYIEYDQCDLYISEMEKGEIKYKSVDHKFYISTNYAYEDRLINGNQTRYKVHHPIIFVKNNRYDVIYNGENCYCPFEEDGIIQFVLYEDFEKKIQEDREY